VKVDVSGLDEDRSQEGWRRRFRSAGEKFLVRRGPR
jgi:hypothetical protein